MTLINCSECGSKVSTNATSCPHCGNPKKFFEGDNSEKVSPLKKSKPFKARPNAKLDKKKSKKPLLFVSVMVLSLGAGFAYLYEEGLFNKDESDNKKESGKTQVEPIQGEVPPQKTEDQEELTKKTDQKKLQALQNDFPGIRKYETPEQYASRMSSKYPGLKSEETIKTYNKRMAFIKRQSPDSFLYPLSKTTFHTTAISDITLPDFNELDVKDLAPVVEAAAPTMSAAGMNNDKMTKAMAGIGLALPKTMQQRCDPKKRIARLKSGGGKTMTEAAIVKGLKWLQTTQDPEGSWGEKDKDEKGNPKPSDKNAMTGMALLCFLGHCELQDSPDYGGTVQKAIKFLTSTTPEPKIDQRGSYSHPIRTYALCEAYTMTEIKRLEEFAKRATIHIIKGQNENGGWGYSYGKGPAAHTDLSVAGWNIQALKAAAYTGIEISGLDEAMDKAIKYVKECQDNIGRFAYQRGRTGKPSLTGTGVLSLQMWKNAGSIEVRKGLDWIVANQKKEWKDVNIYEWYYHAQACFQATGVSGGSKYWGAWNNDFQQIVCGAQQSDGHWPHGAHFHGDTAIFRTTMAILMLEVYYRYMPSGLIEPGLTEELESSPLNWQESDLLVLKLVGETHFANERYEDALKTFIEAFNGLVLVYGKHHPHVGDTLRYIGHIYALKKDFRRAKKFLSTSVDIYSQNFGKSHSITIAAQKLLDSLN
jgi:hypothetical protein